MYYRHIYYKYNTWFKFALYRYILFWIKRVILVYTFVKIVLSGYRNLLTWFLVLLVYLYRYRDRYRNIYFVVLYRFASKIRVVYTRARTWTLFYLTYLVVLVLPCVGTQERTFLEYTARKSTFSCVCIFGSLSWGWDMGLYTHIGYIMVFCSYPEIFCLYFQEYEDLSILVSKCYRGRYLKMANIPLRGYLRKSMLFTDKFRFKKKHAF